MRTPSLVVCRHWHNNGNGWQLFTRGTGTEPRGGSESKGRDRQTDNFVKRKIKDRQSSSKQIRPRTSTWAFRESRDWVNTCVTKINRQHEVLHVHSHSAGPTGTPVKERIQAFTWHDAWRFCFKLGDPQSHRLQSPAQYSVKHFDKQLWGVQWNCWGTSASCQTPKCQKSRWLCPQSFKRTDDLK